MDVDTPASQGARPVTGREMALVALQAILMFLALTAWNPHPFLYDDNLSQWLPVTDQGIGELLAGETPIWNPYISNGIRVDQVGYYGFANPIMIAAYLIGRTGLSNTMSLYIFLTFAIGSLFAHLLARRLGSDWRRSCLLVAMYQMSVTYWCHGHWHYVFNNFKMGPAILWGVHRFLDAPEGRERSARAWQLGGLVGLAAGLGNIQYGITQWILAAGVLTPPLVGRFRRDLGNLARIAAVAGLIALPTVWMAKSAGTYPVGFTMECSSRPLSVWGALGHNLRLDALWDFSLAVGDPNDVCRVGGLAIVAAGALLWLVRRRSHSAVSALACLGVLVCFLTFASGWVVESLPVLNKFRYAFKWWFLIPPLALELACLTPRLECRLSLRERNVLSRSEGNVLSRSERRHSLDAALLALGLVWAVFDVSSLYPVGRNTHPEPFYDVRGFAELRERIDLKNYRYMPVVAGPTVDLLGFEAHASQAFAGDHLCANVPAYLKAYSAVGYHVGLDLNQAVSLYEVTGSPLFYCGVPLNLTDIRDRIPLQDVDVELAGTTDEEAERVLAGRRIGPDNILLNADRTAAKRFWSVQNGELLITSEWRPRLSGWRERFRAAGIRYLIALTRDVDRTIETLSAAEPGQTHSWTVIRGPRYSAIEIPGAEPLVADSEGRAIEFATVGNGLTAFVGPRSSATDVAVRFNHSRAFRAVAVSNDGRRQALALDRGPDGMMWIALPAGDWNRIEVRINDRRVLAAALANLFACGLIVTAFRRRAASIAAPRAAESRPPLRRAA